MRSSRLFTAVGVVLLLQAGGVYGADPSNGNILWVDDAREALRIARREAKPILFAIGTTWCPPCRVMDAEFWPDPEVVEVARKFVSVKIDGDHARALVTRYRVDAFPTLLFLDPWGEEMVRIIGYRHDETLVVLRGLPGDFSPIVAAHARAEHDRKSLEPLLELGTFYGEYELYQISTEYYEKALKTKSAKNDPAVMGDILTTIGWNRIMIGDHRKARKSFERCLKKAGNHPGLDKTLYGLLTACLALDWDDRARDAFDRLCADCPNSELIDVARRELGDGAP